MVLVAKMDEDAAQERLRRMFALQKETENRLHRVS